MHKNYTIHENKSITTTDSFGRKQVRAYHPSMESIFIKENEIESLEKTLPMIQNFNDYYHKQKRTISCYNSLLHKSVFAFSVPIILLFITNSPYLSFFFFLSSSILLSVKLVLTTSNKALQKKIFGLKKTKENVIFQIEEKKKELEIIKEKNISNEKEKNITHVIDDQKELQTLKYQLIASFIVGSEFDFIKSADHQGHLYPSIQKLLDKNYDLPKEDYPYIYEYIQNYLKENNKQFIYTKRP